MYQPKVSKYQKEEADDYAEYILYFASLSLYLSLVNYFLNNEYSQKPLLFYYDTYTAFHFESNGFTEYEKEKEELFKEFEENLIFSFYKTKFFETMKYFHDEFVELTEMTNNPHFLKILKLIDFDLFDVALEKGNVVMGFENNADLDKKIKLLRYRKFLTTLTSSENPNKPTPSFLDRYAMQKPYEYNDDNIDVFKDYLDDSDIFDDLDDDIDNTEE